jgi:hypothetical protein
MRGMPLLVHFPQFENTFLMCKRGRAGPKSKVGFVLFEDNGNNYDVAPNQFRV